MYARPLLLALVLLAIRAVPAEPQDPARLAAALSEIDGLMRGFAEHAGVPGFAYGVVVDGRLVHVGAAGVLDVAAGAPVGRGTVFRIGSMTKSFTAVAILQLRDEGRLSLDDPVARYLPELASLPAPEGAPELTIRHLLTHSGGFPEDNPWGDRQLDATEAEFTAMLRAGIPFSTMPGTAYEYSNFGFAILGRVVERVAGMPYERRVEERILRPLGMTATTMEPADVPAARLAHGYRREGSAWVAEPQLPHGAFGAMGGMLSSVDDLGRWVGWMLDAWHPERASDGAPLRASSRREMQQMWRYAGASAGRDPSGGSVALSVNGYGYGLRFAQSCLFPAIVGHGGGLPGFGSLMRWLPDRGAGIVALGNLTYTSWGAVADQALEVLARAGAAEARAARPAPELLERQTQVSRLLARWNDALADTLAAENLFLDEPRERRRASYVRLVAETGGECRPEGAILAENALRGRWRLRCRDRDLAVSVTLAPTRPARVQFLDVTPLGREETLAPVPVCR